MKIQELINKSKEDLRSLLAERRMRAEELRELIHQKKVKNTREIRSVRKTIARILTILGKGRSH